MEKVKELNIKNWVDAEGVKINPIKLADLGDKYKVIFCFQSWCPGCHSSGFPSLKKMIDALSGDNKVSFIAIQTVFEGFQENTYDKMLEQQKKYELKIPFAHDAGDDDNSFSNFMKDNKTGGTPWFLIVDDKNNIVFSDFRLLFSKISNVNLYNTKRLRSI